MQPQGARRELRRLRRAQGLVAAAPRRDRCPPLHGRTRDAQGRPERRRVRQEAAHDDRRRSGRAPARLVDRDFTAPAPNRQWVARFSYVATWSGVVYVAFAIDAFSRRIVGWKADATMKTSLVLDTLEMALWARDHHGEPVPARLVHHSDAGSQYTSSAFTQSLVDAGADPSVGSIGGRIRQRPRRDDDRPLQDRADQPSGTVEDDRPGRAPPRSNGSTGTTTGGYTRRAAVSLPSSMSRRGRDK